jgi:uncharacterized delta-60 repeat protein
MNSKTAFRVESLEDRLTPAGQLDPTFGTGGVVSFANQSVRTLLSVAADGDTFVSVSGGVERLNPDGAPDPAFGTGGLAPLPAGSTDSSGIYALPDGGVLLVGPTPGGAGSSFSITKLNSTGVLDTNFGSGGTAVIGFDNGASTAVPLAATITPDGRIVVVGLEYRASTLDGSDISVGGMAVVRLTANGQPDPTFGSGQMVSVPFPYGQFNQATAYSVSVAPDGRIVLAGYATVDGYKTSRGPGFPLFWATIPGLAVVRLLPDGKLDPTFGVGGRVLIPVPHVGFTLNQYPTVKVQADGRVLVAGAGNISDGPEAGISVGVAVRLSAAGTFDSSYGAGGQPVVKSTGGAPEIDFQNRVVFFDSGYDNIFRLTGAGALDPGFGTNGRVDEDDLPGLVPAGDSDSADDVAALPNGDLLLGLRSQVGGVGATSGRVARLIGSNPPTGFVSTVPGTLVAGGAANGTVQVLNPAGGTYSAAGPTVVYPGFPGVVRGTAADINGDGTLDYVVGAGPGGAPQITVFDGANGRLLADFPAFEASFAGGVFVAAADLDGDGAAEIVATPDEGGGGRVVIFSVAPGGTPAMRASFFGIDDPNFRGGARVATGDVDHDGTVDLIVAAGFLGGPRTAIFDGATVLSSPARLVNDFFAFPGADATTLRNGVFVAAGDVNGDGFADLVFGGGPGGAPRVLILDGALVAAGKVAEAQTTSVANFFVDGNQTDRGGVRVAVADADGDSQADVAAGSGVGSPAKIRVYRGTDLDGGEPASFQDIIPFGGATLASGVYVG